MWYSSTESYDHENFLRRVLYWKKKMSCDRQTAEAFVTARDVHKGLKRAIDGDDLIKRAAALVVINHILKETRG